MNSYEKQEIAALPDKYRPLGAWSYFGYTILFSIPLIGWIFIIVFALSGSNIVRRSFARSYFCILLLAIILIVIAGAILGFGNILQIFQQSGAQ